MLSISAQRRIETLDFNRLSLGDSVRLGTIILAITK